MHSFIPPDVRLGSMRPPSPNLNVAGRTREPRRDSLASTQNQISNLESGGGAASAFLSLTYVPRMRQTFVAILRKRVGPYKIHHIALWRQKFRQPNGISPR